MQVSKENYTCPESKHLEFRGLRENTQQMVWLVCVGDTPGRESPKGMLVSCFVSGTPHHPLGWVLLSNATRGPQRTLRGVPAGEGELEAGPC